MNETIEQQNQKLAPAQTHDVNQLLFDPVAMKQVMGLAEIMSSSKITVPRHFQGSTGDCVAVIMQAAQWGMNPFAVAQKTHIVSGNLGYEAQLVNAVVSSSKAIRGRFHYEYSGDWPNNGSGNDEWVRVGAILAGENEITWGERLYPAKVTTKNSPLWKTNPKQQAAYLAVKYWARLYCPDVILGVYSADEFEDQPEREINPLSKHVDDQKTELPIYSESDFNKYFSIWSGWIEAGKATVDSVIKKVQTKAILTEDQIKKLRSLEGNNEGDTA